MAQECQQFIPGEKINNMLKVEEWCSNDICFAGWSLSYPGSREPYETESLLLGKKSCICNEENRFFLEIIL